MLPLNHRLKEFLRLSSVASGRLARGTVDAEVAQRGIETRALQNGFLICYGARHRVEEIV